MKDEKPAPQAPERIYVCRRCLLQQPADEMDKAAKNSLSRRCIRCGCGVFF